MISEKAVDTSELMSYCKRYIASYCDNNRLPQLPVKYGPVGEPIGPRAKASFIYQTTRYSEIHVWTGLSRFLEPKEIRERVRYLLEVISHELVHYNQYIHAIRAGKKISREIFNEDEAYLLGKKMANEAVSNMSLEVINPMKRVIGTWPRRNVLPQRISGTTWKRKGKETLSKEERAERYRYLRSIGYTANDASRIRDFYPWNYRRWATPESAAEIAGLRAAYPASYVPNPWFIPAIRAGVRYGPAAYKFGKSAYGFGKGAYRYSKAAYGTIRGKK